MKNLIILLFTIASVGTCQPEKSTDTPQSLEGTWQLVEQKIGIGSADTQWSPVENGMTIEFKTDPDQSFKQSEHTNCLTGTYKIEKKQFTLYYNCPDYPEEMTHAFEFKDGFLYTRPLSVICTDGCDFKYKKIANH